MKMLAMAITKTLPMMMMMAMIDEDVIAIAVTDGLKCMTADLAPAMTLALTSYIESCSYIPYCSASACSECAVHTYMATVCIILCLTFALNCLTVS